MHAYVSHDFQCNFIILLRDFSPYYCNFIISVTHQYCFTLISQFVYIFSRPHQWWSGIALKAGRWQVPGSNSGRACQPTCLEFSVVFSETSVNTGQDPLERPPRRASHLQAQVLLETIGLNTYTTHRISLIIPQIRGLKCITGNLDNLERKQRGFSRNAISISQHPNTTIHNIKR